MAWKASLQSIARNVGGQMLFSDGRDWRWLSCDPKLGAAARHSLRLLDMVGSMGRRDDGATVSCEFISGGTAARIGHLARAEGRSIRKSLVADEGPFVRVARLLGGRLQCWLCWT